MGKKKLKDFIQTLQNKISLVVAITVIKSKPDYLTAEQYALMVQGLIFNHWVQNSNPSIFENKIIEFQRDKLIKEIKDLALESCQHLSKLNECIPGVCSEQYLSNDLFFDSDSDSSDHDIFKCNLSFIHAIVQLKFAVDSSVAVSINTVQTLLSSISKKDDMNSQVTQRMIGYSEDSGFGEKNSENHDSLSPSTFRFITHSSKTADLIKKCMTSVLKFAYTSIMYKTIDTFESWKGSDIEYLCLVFQEISFHPFCSDNLLKLVLKVLDDSWMSKDINKHLTWEYQHHILSEFCVNALLCETVINFIMSKFNSLADTISMLEIGRTAHLQTIIILEKLPHFSKFVFNLLKKLHSFTIDDKRDVRNNTYSNVKDLWKLKWKEENEKETELGEHDLRSLLIKWKSTCEKLITTSAENFSIVSLLFMDIMTNLGAWIESVSQ